MELSCCGELIAETVQDGDSGQSVRQGISRKRHCENLQYFKSENKRDIEKKFWVWLAKSFADFHVCCPVPAGLTRTVVIVVGFEVWLGLDHGELREALSLRPRASLEWCLLALLVRYSMGPPNQ
jgi:hypothetical protein